MAQTGSRWFRGVTRCLPLLVGVSWIGQAPAVHAAACGVMQFAPINQPPDPGLPGRLTETLAERLRERGVCERVAVFDTNSYRQGCESSESCVGEFARAFNLHAVATGTLHFDDAAALVQVRRFDSSQGFFVGLTQQKVPLDDASMDAFVATAIGQQFQDAPSEQVPRPAGAPTRPVEPPQPELGLVVEDENEDLVDFDSVDLDRTAADLIAEQQQQQRQAVRIELEEVPDSATRDLAQDAQALSREDAGDQDEGQARPTVHERLGLRVYGGQAHYQERLTELGLELRQALGSRLFWDVDIGAQLGSKRAERNDRHYRYLLVPVAMGLGVRPAAPRFVDPYLGIDAAALLYQYESPQDFAVAGGGRLRGGLELPADRRWALYLEGSGGFFLAPQIRRNADEAYLPLAPVASFRTGIVLHL